MGTLISRCLATNGLRSRLMARFESIFIDFDVPLRTLVQRHILCRYTRPFVHYNEGEIDREASTTLIRFAGVGEMRDGYKRVMTSCATFSGLDQPNMLTVSHFGFHGSRGVSTCSNHAERLHPQTKSETQNLKGPEHRLSRLVYVVKGRFERGSLFKHEQATNLLRKIKKKDRVCQCPAYCNGRPLAITALGSETLPALCQQFRPFSPINSATVGLTLPSTRCPKRA
jgi:hypothetical protein